MKMTRGGGVPQCQLDTHPFLSKHDNIVSMNYSDFSFLIEENPKGAIWSFANPVF